MGQISLVPLPIFRTITEQVAGHLRGELLRGQWTGTMPGPRALSAELGVNRKTVEAALQLLVEEGILVPQGSRRARRIVLPRGATGARPLRVALLHYEQSDRSLAIMVDLVHELSEAGHAITTASKSLIEMGMNVGRVARLVGKTDADAWVVGAASGEVLRWFAAQANPAFALFGRRGDVPIAAAGPDKVSAYAEVARSLHQLGHHRIVLIARKERRTPAPGQPERAFLRELDSLGHPVSRYNLPDWEDTKQGFNQLLGSLFGFTPPTALMIDEAFELVAALQFFSTRGIRVPEDVSLVCADGDTTFSWCERSVAHIRWDYRPVVRRVVRWAANVSRDTEDRRQTLTKAEFVPGDTMGPAPT